jgi:hypothetical protein
LLLASLSFLYSPFGKRCTSLHDPRVQGHYDSWLPHTETQGNTTSTDINVDAYFQTIQHEIHCGTPFGESFLPQVDTWNDLYQRIGNIYYGSQKNSKTAEDDSKKRPASSVLTSVVKLQIALQMRGPPGFSFKYQPRHIIHGEPCMVLQKRYFRIIGGTPSKQRVIPVSESQYNKRSPKDVVVFELAFGPDGDSTARPVALWFNIPPQKILEVALYEAKRFRWKRGLKNATEKRQSPFDQMDHFQMIRPHNDEAYNLTTEILRNRLDTLQAEQIVNLKERASKFSKVWQQKDQLKDQFNALLRHWLQFGWPVNKGRSKVDKRTPAPSVDTKYEFPVDRNAENHDDASHWESSAQIKQGDGIVLMGQKTHRLWESFTEFIVRVHVFVLSYLRSTLLMFDFIVILCFA